MASTANSFKLARRALLALALALLASALPSVTPASAATTSEAEAFVAGNIDKGLNILNNKSLSAEQRRSQFEGLLTNLTDMKRIADFTLGQYRRTASPADIAAFEGAFQNYAVAVYQSYFAKYAGQTLKVTGSEERAPDDFIVHTQLISPDDHSGQPPPEVAFRVRPDTRPGADGKLVVTDVAYQGIYISLEERDQFTSFLGQNNDDIHTLIVHLSDLVRQFKNG